MLRMEIIKDRHITNKQIPTISKMVLHLLIQGQQETISAHTNTNSRKQLLGWGDVSEHTNSANTCPMRNEFCFPSTFAW